MTRFCFVFIAMCLSCNIKENCEKVNLSAFTHYQMNIKPNDKKIEFQVFDAPNGNSIFDLPSDEESGWGIDIIEKKGDYFKIRNIWRQEAKALNYWDNDWMKEYEFVWILKGSIALNTRNYDSQVIALFTNATESSEEIAMFDNVQTVIVYDICGDWAFVEAIDNKGNLVRGWLAPKWQCSNPLSTCS